MSKIIVPAVKCTYDEMVDLSDLKPHPDNPNVHTDEQIQLLAKIMAHQGIRRPIIVSENSGYIISGHGRLEAAKVNGWTRFPVDYQDYDSEEQEYEDLVADNAISELSKINLAKVNLDIDRYGPDLDLEMLGIPDFKVDPSEFASSSEKKNKSKNKGDLSSIQIVHKMKCNKCDAIILECPECGEKWDQTQN